MPMDKKEFEEMINSVENNSCSAKLYLIDEGIDASHAARLAVALTKNTTLQTLYLNNNKIGDSGASALAKMLESNKTLQTLYLNNNKIAADLLKTIEQALDRNKALAKSQASSSPKLETKQAVEQVVAAQQGTIVYGAEEAKGVQETSNLPTLSSSMAMDKKAFEEMINLVKNNDCGAKLYLRYKNFDVSQVTRLALALSKNTTLQTLDLSGSCVTTDLEKALESNKTVQNLSLSNCHIANSGASALAKMLESNKTLQTLDLTINHIGDSGAVALAKTLGTNETLQDLDLYYNEIGDSGATALAKMLQSNKTLQSLNLGGNRIGDNGVAALAKMLESNKTLQSLNLNFNQIGDTGVIALAKVLGSNKTLRTLELGDNKNGNPANSDLLKAIKQALDRNKALSKSQASSPTEHKTQQETDTTIQQQISGTAPTPKIVTGTVSTHLLDSAKTEILLHENPQALYELGIKFAKGEGCEIDMKKAHEFLKRAAEMEHVDAQFSLGWIYGNGGEMAQDNNLACKWYEKAATRGHIIAQYNLGLKYAKGEGVSQNMNEACRWLKKAAEQGHKKAILTLKKIYSEAADAKQAQENASLSSPSSWLDFATIETLQQQVKAQGGLLQKLQSLQPSKELEESITLHKAELARVQQTMLHVDHQALVQLQGKAKELAFAIKDAESKQQAESERALIFSQDKLSDFYYVFITQLTDCWMACKTIHSGKVENSEQTSLDTLAKGVDKLGGYIALPGIKLLTDIAGKAISVWSDRDKKQAVNRMANYFAGMDTASPIIEALARQLTFAYANEIQAIKTLVTGRVRKAWQTLKTLKNSITANDIDNAIKEYSVKFAKEFLSAVMQDKLKAHPTLNDLPILLKSITSKNSSSLPITPLASAAMVVSGVGAASISSVSTAVPKATIAAAIVVTIPGIATSNPASAFNSSGPSMEDLLKQLKAQEDRQKALEKQLKQQAEELAKRVVCDFLNFKQLWVIAPIHAEIFSI